MHNPDPDSISMPPKCSQAVKTRKEHLEYEEKVQQAVDEYWATQMQMPKPSQEELANKYGIKRPTLSVCIQGRPSKLESASKHQKIYSDEEKLIVEYLQETARQGFPDTRRRCLRHVNEVLRAQSGNLKAKVGKCWLDCFLTCHHDSVQCYWSTSLTNVQGGALNPAVVDDWFTLLDATITNYGIEQDCIFSMDETCCFLDKCVHKTCHIGPANQLWQMALRNEERETATMLPIISASGVMFPPTIIFKGELLRGKGAWDNPLNMM